MGAAIKIQSRIRIALANTKVEGLMRDFEDRHAAACQIQAIARGNLARKVVDYKKQREERIQANAAASLIQGAERGRRVRKRMKEENKAAVIIQAAVRVGLAKNQVERAWQEFETRNAAAITAQTLYRSHLGKQIVQEMKNMHDKRGRGALVECGNTSHVAYKWAAHFLATEGEHTAADRIQRACSRWIERVRRRMNEKSIGDANRRGIAGDRTSPISETANVDEDLYGSAFSSEDFSDDGDDDLEAMEARLLALKNRSAALIQAQVRGQRERQRFANAAWVVIRIQALFRKKPNGASSGPIDRHASSSSRLSDPTRNHESESTGTPKARQKLSTRETSII